MKHQAEKPQPFGAAEHLATIDHLHIGITKKRPEQENLAGHSSDNTHLAAGIFERIVLNPGQAFLLAAGGRNAERNRGLCPFYNPVHKAEQEKNKYGIRDNHRQKIASRRISRDGRGQKGNTENQNEGQQYLHKESHLSDRSSHDGSSPKRIIGFCMPSRALTINSTSPP